MAGGRCVLPLLRRRLCRLSDVPYLAGSPGFGRCSCCLFLGMGGCPRASTSLRDVGLCFVAQRQALRRRRCTGGRHPSRGVRDAGARAPTWRGAASARWSHGSALSGVLCHDSVTSLRNISSSTQARTYARKSSLSGDTTASTHARGSTSVCLTR